MSFGSGVLTIARQNQYLNLFTQLCAIDREHAVTLEEAGIERSIIFNTMCARGIFIRCENNRFYMDTQAAMRFKAQRHRKKYILLIGLVIFLILSYIIKSK